MAAVNRVAIVTLGCARNEVDSEELAGRLAADGWELVSDAEAADAVLVNTCGFIDAAKKDSIDTILDLAAPDPTVGPGGTGGHAVAALPVAVGRPVVAVGCLAQRYGDELARELPEAAAVLGFDEYEAISTRLRDVVSGKSLPAHQPSDRRLLLPITPVDRVVARERLPVLRQRLDSAPMAPVKIAAGCDRRCTFCAIPSFRGAFVSRELSQVLEDVRWLGSQRVGELLFVSENSTSYGKDLPGIALDGLLVAAADALTAVVGPLARVRVSYLQPAEMREPLVKTIATTVGVAPYFDLSFQHAHPATLRRMRRFGSGDDFLRLIGQIRGYNPRAGIRTNVIVGFPGETDSEFEALMEFLAEAQLDAVGVFGYSDEEGTAAAGLPDKLSEGQIRDRVEATVALVDELMEQRAARRIGERVEVLVESLETGDGSAQLYVREGCEAPFVGGAQLVRGRAAHQGPADSEVIVHAAASTRIGTLISAKVIAVQGVDLIAIEES